MAERGCYFLLFSAILGSSATPITVKTVITQSLVLLTPSPSLPPSLSSTFFFRKKKKKKKHKMVVLAAAVMTNPPKKAGKVLLSRQYVDMTRIRIEGLLAALPRLMTPGSQHTFIETDSVRYLYQPFEGMLIVLVTNKGSNIVEDLEILRRMGMLMTEIVPPSPDQGQGSKRTELEVSETAFEIMFAFDELLSMGYRNNITIEGVMTALDMQSQEEEMAIESIKIQLAQVKIKTKEEEKRIKKQKEHLKEGRSPPQTFETNTPKMEVDPLPEPAVAVKQQPTRKSATGMKVGGLNKKSKKDTFAAILEEDGVEAPVEKAKGGAAPRAQGSSAASDQADVVVGVKEQITASFDSEGNLLEVPKVKGILSLTVPNKEHSFFELQFKTKGLDRKNFDMRPNPKLDNKLFEETALLRSKPETKQAFPLGQPQQILRWGLRPQASFEVPLTLSIWGDEDNILVQYELSDDTKEFVNAVVRIPACGETGVVEEDDICHYSPEQDCFIWQINKIDADTPQAGVNITWNSPVPVANITPLVIEFQSPTPLAGLVMTDVLAVGPGALWYRRRSLLCCSARRSCTLGKLGQKYPDVIKNIAEFL